MRLPRFRLRTLLVLVALAGIGAGGYALWRRSAEYSRRADEANGLRQVYLDLAEQHRIQRELSGRVRSLQDEFRKHLAQVKEILPGTTVALEEKMRRDPEVARRTRENQLLDQAISEATNSVSSEDGMEREAIKVERIADHFAALRAKYDRAARYPFLPVAPILPCPNEPRHAHAPRAVHGAKADGHGGDRRAGDRALRLDGTSPLRCILARCVRP